MMLENYDLAEIKYSESSALLQYQTWNIKRSVCVRSL